MKPTERELVEQLAERVRVELTAAGFDLTAGARERVASQRPAPSVGQVDRDRVAAEAVAVCRPARFCGRTGSSRWGRRR